MITLDDARRHLRIDGNDFDTEIQQKLDAAAALVTKYARPVAADVGNEGLDAATLLVLGDLWANRESSTGDALSATVRNLLDLFRPVTFA